jgi:putative ABC transport system permease protein
MKDLNPEKSYPPKTALSFFRWFCHPKLHAHIEGDLLEEYGERVKRIGKRKADLQFVIDVLLLFRPSIIKPMEGYQNLNNYGMLKNYFKIGWRNLIRNRSNTAINVVGLSLGITCSIILFLIVKHGVSFDRFHSKGERIYRVVSKTRNNSGYHFTQGIPLPLPQAIKNDFQEIEQVAFTSYRRVSMITVHHKDGAKKYEEPKGVAFADQAFFKVFDRKLLNGPVETSLDDPNEAIISKKWALNYFSKLDVIGEVVEYEKKQYSITAVMEDFPVNTDLPFELILSSVSLQQNVNQADWGNVSDSDNCYFLLREGIHISTIERQLAAFTQKYIDSNQSGQTETSFILQPLFDIHSDTRFGNYNSKLPKEAQIAFSLIAIFLLITACVNFINLTTAEALKRTREVGMRKILGSTRIQLVYQFVIEALMVVTVSIFVALSVASFSIGFINSFMDLSLSMSMLLDGTGWIFLITLLLFMTLLSGLYPSWLTARFQPVEALKNNMNSKKSGGYLLRQSLVVAQFFISQFFIIGTIVITKQMNFIQNHDVGFSTAQIIALPIPEPATDSSRQVQHMRTLKNQLLQVPGVEEASLNFGPPMFKGVVGSNFSLAGDENMVETQVKQVDGDYLSLYNLSLAAGKPLPDLDTMTCAVVNEKLAAVLGLDKRELIGKEISFWGRNVPVIGVVKDFNTQSLSKAIEPIIMVNGASGYHSLSAKINPAHFYETISEIQRRWEAHYPDFIFSYSFVDEDIKNMYRGEQKLSTLLSIFSFIAITIGCLGLFGLAAFIANQKTKEIGVRKVMGASVSNILFMFSTDFGKLIIIGFALSAPVAGLAMSKLLQQYAYKIEIGFSIFVISLLATFGIALLTVGYRSFKAATANPISSLRSE